MKSWVAALGLSGIGFFIAVCIILGVWGGRWLDNKLNSAPVFLIVGLILGIAVAFYGVYNMLRPFLSNKREGRNN
jgi:F0F1-type ATP synthase assembly protein I